MGPFPFYIFDRHSDRKRDEREGEKKYNVIFTTGLFLKEPRTGTLISLQGLGSKLGENISTPEKVTALNSSRNSSELKMPDMSSTPACTVPIISAFDLLNFYNTGFLSPSVVHTSYTF